MLNKREFARIRKDMKDFETKRESLILKSREVIQLSKRIIYAVHRDELASSESLVKEIEQKKKELRKIGANLDTNIDKTALQEYAEALCYYHFVKDKKIPTPSSLGIDAEHYLLGLCDLTGELGRRAVAAVINKRFDEVLLIKEVVEEIYGEFLKLDLRNNELRKKSDAIKWNLKKIEDVIFDARVKGMF